MTLEPKGTIKFRLWAICYKKEVETKQEAMAREKELKSAKLREWIWSLINEKIKAGFISAGGGREFDPPLRNSKSL